MRHRIVILSALLMLALAFTAIPTSAMSGGALNGYTFACDRVTITYGNIHFDRDNTGTGEEAYTFTVTDGTGAEIYRIDSSFIVGNDIVAQTEQFVYFIAPAANPLRVRFFSNAGNGFLEQTLWDFTGECTDLPTAGDGAPGIPDGFVLSSIICDTPVYNTQSGQPVGDTMITAGQTWYVNPTPVNGDDGKQWTEIFAGGFINGFIPTACVG